MDRYVISTAVRPRLVPRSKISSAPGQPTDDQDTQVHVTELREELHRLGVQFSAAYDIQCFRGREPSISPERMRHPRSQVVEAVRFRPRLEAGFGADEIRT